MLPPLQSSLYKCRVRHRRRAPRTHAFTSDLFQFLFDLDELDVIGRHIPIFSRNRFNAYAFYDRDHFDFGQGDVRANLEFYLRREGLTEPLGKVRLLTSPRVFGYGFNPVSYFFIEDPAGEPLAVVAEVHNTFHEIKPFLLTRADFKGNWFRATRLKHFYISPFSALDHQLILRFRFPGETLNLHVSDTYPGERPFFHASLTGERRPLTTRQLLGYTFRFPFVSARVMFLIHWHALRLWKKGVPFHSKSASPELQRGVLAPASSTPSSK